MPSIPRRRLWLPFALALAAAIAPLACGGAAPQSQSTPTPGVDTSSVVLRVGDQQRRLETMIQASGQLNGLKYHVQWAEFTSGPPMMQAASGGALDLGAVGNTPPIFSAAAGGPGADIRIVGASSTGGDRDAILVPASSNVKGVAQLKGKKVAVAQGSSANLTLLLALQKAGLKWGDVQAVNLQPPAAQSAFSAGQIDAWAVWYPFIASALSSGGRTLGDVKDLDPGHSFLVSTRAALQDTAKVAALHDFLHRVALAQRWATNHLQQWAQLYAQISGLTQQQALDTARSQASTYVPIDGTVQKAEQDAADAFAGAGLIGKVDISRILDKRFNADTRVST